MQNKIIPALSYLYNTFILPFARAIGEGLTNLFRDINDESLSAFDVLKRNFGFLTASIGAIALLLYPKKVLGLLKFAARKFGLNIGKAGKDVDDVAKRKVKDVYQSHSILYAVRIPDVDNLESVIPVNTYRIIFNNYFNTNYEYLEQRIFTIFEDRVWVEVTEKFHKYRFD